VPETQRGHPDLLRRWPQGFPDAIDAIFPKTTVQTGIVHLLRQSLKYVPTPIRRRRKRRGGLRRGTP
jgi:putative transposase